jgi:glutamyl-tRNA synthetase
MLVRFDDTNPNKEKDEYEESILADLVTLGVKYETVTHTSDYFDVIQKYAVQMLEAGGL